MAHYVRRPPRLSVPFGRPGGHRHGPPRIPRSCSALSAAGLAANLDLLSLTAHAQTAAADYKALVCVFLFGGNDGNNLLLPADTAGYAQYAAVRGASSGIAITQSELLPIQPRNLGTPFGLHPALKELHPLFASGQLALLANVGTLTQPHDPGAVRVRRAPGEPLLALRPAEAVADLAVGRAVRAPAGAAASRT